MPVMAFHDLLAAWRKMPCAHPSRESLILQRAILQALATGLPVSARQATVAPIAALPPSERLAHIASIPLPFPSGLLWVVVCAPVIGGAVRRVWRTTQ